MNYPPAAAPRNPCRPFQESINVLAPSARPGTQPVIHKDEAGSTVHAPPATPQQAPLAVPARPAAIPDSQEIVATPAQSRASPKAEQSKPDVQLARPSDVAARKRRWRRDPVLCQTKSVVVHSKHRTFVRQAKVNYMCRRCGKLRKGHVCDNPRDPWER